MSHKVLVVDDSLVATKLTEQLLAQHFHAADVLVAQKGADAFDRLQLAHADLILLNDVMPDMDGETICHRLLSNPDTSRIPVVIMASNGHVDHFADRFGNVVRVVEKPVSTEALLESLRQTLTAKPPSGPNRDGLFHDPTRTLFSGHTGFFSIRNSLHMAHGDRLTGVLRFFTHRVPIELFVSQGRFVFATTRNSALYCKDSPVILSGHNLGSIIEAQLTQQSTGCPLFLSLALRGGFPHEDVVNITREHGQRVFSHLWTAGREAFEFEDLAQFPDFAAKFPVSNDEPDNWTLQSLRHAKWEHLAPSQRPDPNGSPAYTRRGYDVIQKLRLNDVEARFATAINGSEPTLSIAKRIGVPLQDALLIVFRFQVLEVIDYWNASVLTLPPMQGQTT